MLTTRSLWALLGICISAPAQAPSIPESVAEHLRREIDRGQRMGVVVGLINADGSSFFAHGRGEAGEARELDQRSVFEIGSISKTFTGILLADMVVRGEVTLDDLVSLYLPDEVEMPRWEGEAITLAHLSTHRSSLPRMPNNFRPRDRANPYADYSVAQMYAFLDGHELRRPIDSEFEYSNLAVGLLGHILARRAGGDYEELLRTRLTGPLELMDTRIELNDALHSRLAKGHSGTTEVKNWDIPTLAGAGAIRSTAADMLRYLAANMGLIETSLSEAMRLAQQRRADASGSSGIGLGWILRPTEDTLITWHNGGTGGYRTFAGFNDQGLGAVVLSNTSTSVDAVGFHLLDPNLELPAPRTAVEVDRSVLERYVGEYELLPTFILTIRLRDGLTVQATGQQEIGMSASSETEFFLTAVEASITFELDDEGAPIALVLHQGGADQRAVRR